MPDKRKERSGRPILRSQQRREVRTYGESDAKAGTVSKGQIGQIERERKVWGKAIRVESDAVMEEALVMADQRTEDDVATTHNVEHAYIRENEL